jgi:hypothetical protein
LLASRAAKTTAERILGSRGRNAFYRPFFLAQATAGFAALAGYIRRQPNSTLYEIRGPGAWAMRTAQAGALLFAISAARQVGIARMLGGPGLRAAIAGRREVPPEPEAQGPALDHRYDQMRATGPFRFSRHPLNFAPIPVFWLNPQMTTNLAAFAAVSTLYFFVGSWHEESCLRRAYGEPYEQYRRSGPRFLVPGRKRSELAPAKPV